MEFRRAPAPHQRGIQRFRFCPTAYIYTKGAPFATPKKSETQKPSEAGNPFGAMF